MSGSLSTGPGRRGLPRSIVVLITAALALGGLLVLAPSMGHGASSVRSNDPVPSGMVCLPAEYTTPHIQVATSDCQAIFWVEFGQNLTTYNAILQGNFSFGIDWIAEVTAGGQIVRIASPLAPFQGSANATVHGNEVDLFSTETMNVTDASGNWTPNDSSAGTGPQWKISDVPVGIAGMEVTWHLNLSSSNNPSNGSANLTGRVKFDLVILDWPWASSSDFLGFQLESLGAAGAHFSYDANSRTLAESWNSTGATFASLVFGGSALAGGWPSSGGTTNNTTSETSLGALKSAGEAPPNPNASVGVQVGLFTAASPDRESVCLVTFDNATGNYSAINYDPWVVFTPFGGTSPPPPLPTGATTGGIPGWAYVALAVTAVAAIFGLISVSVTRQATLRREGTELVRGIRATLTRPPPPSGGSP